MKKEVVFGSTGKGSQTYVVPTLTNAMLGTKFKVITGYRGMGGIYIAMDKKEVQGFQSSWSGFKIGRSHLVDQVNLLAVNALTPLVDHPEVPLLKDIITDPQDKKVAELLGGNMVLGRAWLAPPGVPADRLAALRTAFAKSFADPEAVAGAKKRRMTWESVSWQDQQAAAERISNTDQALIDRMRKAPWLEIRPARRSNTPPAGDSGPGFLLRIFRKKGVDRHVRPESPRLHPDGRCRCQIQ